MRNLQSLRTTNQNNAIYSFAPLPKIETPTSSAELHHRSIIFYDVPSERVRNLLPEEFSLSEKTVLSIESFLDDGRTRFEQSNYRLHISLRGKACAWLLGTSLGSLSAVTTRHLYPLPWHLSAMEFQVGFDAMAQRYTSYRLRSQSQWANASWEITDTGLPLTTSNNNESNDYFIRRDGAIGSYQTIHRPAFATHGKLITGNCDMLQTLGILTADELQCPTYISLQRAVICEIKKSLGVMMAA